MCVCRCCDAKIWEEAEWVSQRVSERGRVRDQECSQRKKCEWAPAAGMQFERKTKNKSNQIQIRIANQNQNEHKKPQKNRKKKEMKQANDQCRVTAIWQRGRHCCQGRCLSCCCCLEPSEWNSRLRVCTDAVQDAAVALRVCSQAELAQASRVLSLSRLAHLSLCHGQSLSN